MFLRSEDSSEQTEAKSISIMPQTAAKIETLFISFCLTTVPSMFYTLGWSSLEQ
jgi:hypothetical protein